MSAGCGLNPNPPRPAVTGTLNGPRAVVTPSCTVEIQLNDLSLAAAPAFTLAREFISPRETSPSPFGPHDTAQAIQSRHRYVISAKITQGNPSHVAITLKQVGTVR